MKIHIYALFFISAFLLFAQHIAFSQSTPQGKTTALNLSEQNSGFYHSSTTAIPLENVSPFLAYALSWKNNSTAAPLQIRFSEDGKKWQPWQAVEEGAHINKTLDWTVSELMFADKKNRFFQIQLRQTYPLEQLQVRWYSPGETLANMNTTPENSNDISSDCPCPLPALQNREMWCPSGDCPPNPTPTETSVTHLIVHHSAGTNISNDWAAVVRSIWDFHVNSNGWSDIGYNYLVDANGVLYEGRGDDILGAHFCGTNSKTMGTCVMGNFTNITPTAEAQMGLTRLLAWKACDRSMDPLDSIFHGSSGLLLPRIAGHQDGCATACPGNSFYPSLPEIRQGVADFIENDCAFLDTGIEVFFNETTVRVFPNPANEHVNIEMKNDWAGRLELTLSNIEGKVLEQQFLNKKTSLINTVFNLKPYTSGVYFIKINTTEGQKGWRIVIN